MGYAELIQQRLKTLPPDKQAEVYDFVEFIASRAASVTPSGTASLTDTLSADWSDDEFSSLSMAQALRGLESDPVSYGLTDLKERWS